MQPPQPPFQPPTAVPPVDPASKVGPPAIGLIVTGAIGILVGLLRIFARGILLGVMASNPEFARMPMASASGAMDIVFGIVGIGTSALVIYGAMQMQKLQSYGLAMAATIVAMVPCLGPCCCVGIPIGVWSLIVLLDANVKPAFRS